MRLIACALVLAAVSWVDTARATDPAAAQVLFNQARQAARRGDYTSACPMFEESQRLDPAIGTKFNLADCYEHAGRTASAWALFLEVAGATKIVGQNAREIEARARANALSPRLSMIVVTAPANAPDGLDVKRDGEPVGAAQWAKPIPIDPGRHTFVATAPGRSPWRSTVEIPTGTQRTSLAIPELSAAPANEAAEATSQGDTAAPLPAAEPEGLGGQKVAALVVGGIGVVGLATGSVFGLVSLSKHGSSDQGCNAQSVCTAAAAATRTEAIHAGNVSTVAFAIGAAAVTAGVVLWVTAPRATGSSTAVGFAPSPNGAAMVGTW